MAVGCHASPRAAATQGRVAAAPHPDRRVGFLEGLGLEPYSCEREEPAVEVGWVLGPEGHHDSKVLIGEPAPLVGGYAQGAELVGGAPSSHPQYDPAPRQGVQAGDHLGRHEGIAVRDHDDRGAQLDPPGEGRRTGQHHERVVEHGAHGLMNVLRGHHVVADPDRVEAHLLRTLDRGAELVHGEAVSVVWYAQAKLHIGCPTLPL